MTADGVNSNTIATDGPARWNNPPPAGNWMHITFPNRPIRLVGVLAL